MVEVVRGRLGALVVALPEGADDLARARGHAAHEARVQQVAARDAGVAHAALDGIVEQASENILELGALLGRARGGNGLLGNVGARGLVAERVQHEVGGVGHVLLADEPPVERIGDKIGDPPLNRSRAVLDHSVLPPRARARYKSAHSSRDDTACDATRSELCGKRAERPRARATVLLATAGALLEKRGLVAGQSRNSRSCSGGFRESATLSQRKLASVHINGQTEYRSRDFQKR